MAAGRGQFFDSIAKILDRLPPGGLQSGRSRQGTSPGGGRSGPGRGQSGARQKRRQPRAAAPSSISGSNVSRSYPELRTEGKKADFSYMKTSPSKENLLERLPSEILIKILWYLDASSLVCISHVSKLFRQLAYDEWVGFLPAHCTASPEGELTVICSSAIWRKIYMSEFGSQAWRLKWVDDAAPKVDPAVVSDRPTGHWRKLYFRAMAGQEMNKWKRELRDISPYTGLPRQTEWVLRRLNVSWELTLFDGWGRETTLRQSRVFFFETSVIVYWSDGRFPKYRDIFNIQLHGVRKETPKSPEVRKLGWRSLILKLEVRTSPSRVFGRDRIVKLMYLPPCFIIGVWRGNPNEIAFIMVSLHFHRLVEKSLLGSPACPYSEPVGLSHVDNSDPELGLQDYSLHFVLHNTGTEIMSGNFRKLSCDRDAMEYGLFQMKVIDRTDLSQHRSLSGNIKLPWKIEPLGDAVENCCIMTLTLLDEFQKPFWCISSPILIKRAIKTLRFDYDGEYFLMVHQTSEGRVTMELVWLKEQKQFFLVGLTVSIAVYRVNERFGREY